MLAWELGCKGITVYVTGSREKVVLETKATAEKKDASLRAGEPAAPAAAPQSKPSLKLRPRICSGYQEAAPACA